MSNSQEFNDKTPETLSEIEDTYIRATALSSEIGLPSENRPTSYNKETQYRAPYVTKDTQTDMVYYRDWATGSPSGAVPYFRDNETQSDFRRSPLEPIVRERNRTPRMEQSQMVEPPDYDLVTERVIQKENNQVLQNSRPASKMSTDTYTSRNSSYRSSIQTMSLEQGSYAHPPPNVQLPEPVVQAHAQAHVHRYDPRKHMRRNSYDLAVGNNSFTHHSSPTLYRKPQPRKFAKSEMVMRVYRYDNVMPPGVDNYAYDMEEHHQV